MKIVIKETYGGQKTYLNQVFLFDDIIENKFTNESVNLLSNENRTEEDNIDSEPVNALNTESEVYIKNTSPVKKVVYIIF